LQSETNRIIVSVVAIPLHTCSFSYTEAG